jgi:hypothetical protein
MGPTPSFRDHHDSCPNSGVIKVWLFSRRSQILIKSIHNGSESRIYAITGKSKLIGGTLALLTAAGLCYFIFAMIWVGLGPRESRSHIGSHVNSSVGSATGARRKLGRVQDLYFQTVEPWRTPCLHLGDDFWYALALRLL